MSKTTGPIPPRTSSAAPLKWQRCPRSRAAYGSRRHLPLRGVARPGAGSLAWCCWHSPPRCGCGGTLVASQMPPETLDPDDWQAMRALAHRAVDDGFDWLSTVRDRPVWQAPPEAVAAHFRQSLPRAPQGAEGAYQEFFDKILPYPMGNVHPRFLAWDMGNGPPLGAIGDFLAAIGHPT